MSIQSAANNKPLTEGAAAAIYQAHLDRVSELIVSNQPNRAAEYFDYPYRVNTVGAETIYETAQDMAEDITGICEFLRAQGATDYIRLTRRAQFLSPDIVEGWHVTHMLRDALSLIQPYESRIIIKRDEGGAWLGVEADHELVNLAYPSRRITAMPGAFAERWARSRHANTVRFKDAILIYEAFLKSYDNATNGDDFDTWCRHMTFPCTMHFQTSDLNVSSREDVRDLFEKHRREVTRPEISGIERRARRASFLSEDRILGYHDTYWVSGDRDVFGPVHCRLILVVDGDFWRASEFTNSIEKAQMIGEGADIYQNLPSLRAVQRRRERDSTL